MIRKPKILFVTEKWTDANPNRPLTNSYHNLFGSLATTGLAEYSCLHYDEYFHKHGHACDRQLIKRVIKTLPDITVVTLLPYCEFCPRNETYETIANYTKIVFIWPDSVLFMHLAEETERYATLVVLWDVDRDWKPGTKFIHLWTPQDPCLYNDPGLFRDIDVSFIGNPNYRDRRLYLGFLKNNGINVTMSGGRHTSKLISSNDYANYLKRSKITLSFSLTDCGKPQLKGRPFEAMLCGAMLMESKNRTNWLERWFLPNVHYVPFAAEQELKDKVIYYLSHDDERITIAQNGFRRCTECYNNVVWWKTIFREVGL